MIELKRVTAYTVPEVAATLGVAPATVYKYIKRGKLRAKKLGNKWYITDITLEEYVAGDEPETQTPTVSSVVSENTGD